MYNTIYNYTYVDCTIQVYDACVLIDAEIIRVLRHSGRQIVLYGTVYTVVDIRGRYSHHFTFGQQVLGYGFNIVLKKN